jgi:hypothetical protein
MGYGLSYAFLTTPLQKVLGPRYAEFDFVAMIIVTFLSALIAWLGATVVAAVGANRLGGTFNTRNLFVLIVAPTLVGLALAFVISGDLVWWVIGYVSSCLGILAGGGLALLFEQTANEKPNHKMKPSGNGGRASN